MQQLAKKNKALHCIGLVSNGGVHSHIDHLKAFLRAAKQAGITQCYIHAFLDGRDVAPQSSIQFLTQLTQFMKDESIGEIASICGRVYGMDRNENWQRTQKAYTLLTKESDKKSKNWHTILNEYYNHGIFDEFIPPTQINHEGIIKKGDGIIFFNFRPDRARQLTEAFTNPNFNHFPTKNLDLSFFITPTNYKSDRCKTTILFPHVPIKNTLKERLSNAGHSIFTCAETEKYAHVTYFFGGGSEKKFPGETRVLIPSLEKKSFIEHPEMSANKITEAVVNSLDTTAHDFYLINYANADMVGHSGSLSATIKAVECLDSQISILFKEFVEKRNGTLIITADHGNAESMYDERNKQPLTSHTTNPVPFIVVNQVLYDKKINLTLKGLADIAPFITSLFST